MSSTVEKGGGSFEGIKLLLCENPLPPFDEAVGPLRQMLAEEHEVPDLGVKTFPTETYFILADFSPHSADDVARRLEERGIPIRPLNDRVLGRGFMRVTTSLPDDNQRFVAALAEILGHGEAPTV